MAANGYRVKDVARITGLTVRALHHYDAIGLLSPKRRTDAGYRLYSDDDLLTLQQILIHRELGLALDKIKAILSDPNFDRRAALQHQRKQLQARAEHTQAMLRAVDAAIAAESGAHTMNTSDIFDGFDPSKHQAEAERRWGGTEQWTQSAQRTGAYTKDDWAKIKAETIALLDRVATLLATGVAPTDVAAMELAEEHRLQIDRFYYTCSHAIHRGLAQMYIADARFADNLDKHGDGVAAFLSAAIEANCDRAAQAE